jgi:hypothetical protein
VSSPTWAKQIWLPSGAVGLGWQLLPVEQPPPGVVLMQTAAWRDHRAGGMVEDPLVLGGQDPPWAADDSQRTPRASIGSKNEWQTFDGIDNPVNGAAQVALVLKPILASGQPTPAGEPHTQPAHIAGPAMMPAVTLAATCS